MKPRLIVYHILNFLFHVLHLSIILFVMLGWMVAAFLPFHLALLLATLGSWFVLGHWLGQGYCPISDWHWEIKKNYGPGKPEGTYIHRILQSITGKALDSEKVDHMVVLATLVLTIGSVILNLTQYLAG